MYHLSTAWILQVLYLWYLHRLCVALRGPTSNCAGALSIEFSWPIHYPKGPRTQSKVKAEDCVGSPWVLGMPYSLLYQFSLSRQFPDCPTKSRLRWAVLHQTAHNPATKAMASLTKSGKIRSSDSKGRLLHPVVSVDEAEFSTKRCAFTSSSSAMKDEVAELSCSITSQHRIKAGSGWTQIDQKAKPRQPRQPKGCLLQHVVRMRWFRCFLHMSLQLCSNGLPLARKQKAKKLNSHTWFTLFLCICFFCLQVPYFEHSSTPYLDKGVTGAVKMMASLSHGRLGRLDGKLHLEWPSNYCAGACELHSHVLKRKSMNKAQRAQRLFFSGPHHTTAKRMTGIRPYLSQALIGIFQLRWIGNDPNSGHGPKQLISSKNVRILREYAAKCNFSFSFVFYV